MTGRVARGRWCMSCTSSVTEAPCGARHHRAIQPLVVALLLGFGAARAALSEAPEDPDCHGADQARGQAVRPHGRWHNGSRELVTPVDRDRDTLGNSGDKAVKGLQHLLKTFKRSLQGLQSL